MEKIIIKNLNKATFNFIKKTNKNRVGAIEIDIMGKKKQTSRLSDFVAEIYNFLDLENDFEVWLKNFPYCLLNSSSRDHVLFERNYKGKKVTLCKKCKENRFCGGFPRGYIEKFGKAEVSPITDLPVEVMIEAETECNFRCNFCFNRLAFAQDGRGRNELSAARIKKIIKNISRLGIGIIRFTGGEPLLRQDIFDLMAYAKSFDLEVRLNTNASLINDKIAARMQGLVDNVLISVHSWNGRKEEKITGYKNSLQKKINAIELLFKNNIPIVRVGTVATKDNIRNFDKLVRLILNLPISGWEFYRPIGLGREEKIDKKNIENLANKIINLRKKTEKKISIANAIPFCAIKNKYKLSLISYGAMYDDGHNRMVVDPGGFLKPDYFINKNVGDADKIKSAWESQPMKKIRGLNYLPKECQLCRFIYKCRGGSRYAASRASKNLFSHDPLARF